MLCHSLCLILIFYCAYVIGAETLSFVSRSDIISFIRASVTNRYTHVRTQLYRKAAAFACVNTKQSAWTRLIPYMSNFIVTYSIRHPSCTNEHRPLCVWAKRTLYYTKNYRLLNLRESNCDICRLKSILKSCGTLSNAASSLIKLSVEYWMLNHQ